ncbi:response regulator transcription factor [Sanguibacter hominis ATCC BAA-789]|uniref:Response regulator transcription factor n=1 Tax=Sanguibacter hominis ATCC BAA-789 TaxID=1312740 RepID=A0A9X5FIQ2_9MICO|nr:response regulator transcription factor [Sanguibacter hominis]NKX92858.1 response regulator transcription factor [Sanguibacter hominis ATCC BAA-789]
MTPDATSSSAPAARVVLVDDDPLVRAGLRMILGGDRSIEIVGEAGDGLEAEEVVGATTPDVVLMDIRMPRRDGLATTEALLASNPDLRIIVLTTFDADDMVLGALRAGATGFLLKDTPPERLVRDVLAAAAGEPTLSPSITAQLIAAVATPGSSTEGVRGVDEPPARRACARERLARLTERELEVAQAIGRGLSNSEIAATLFMSVPTVKSHVGKLFTKLEVDNRVQIAICVHDADLG